MITAIVIFFASIIGILVLTLIVFSILRSRQKSRNSSRHLADTENLQSEDSSRDSDTGGGI